MKGLAATLILFLLIAGHEPPAKPVVQPLSTDSVAVIPQAIPISVPDSIITKLDEEEPIIQTGSVHPQAVVEFAQTLIGTPYLYGSTDPNKGFDCSGFITYVFKHFNVKVPRSSVEFTDVGKDVNYQVSKPGDLILFTGTDSTIRVVGHMGIVVSNENNKIRFIHSTSGKQYGVTVTELSPYYLSRFVRVARVFPDNANSLAYVRPNRMIVVDTFHNVSKIQTVKPVDRKKFDSVRKVKAVPTKTSTNKVSTPTKKSKGKSATTVKKSSGKSTSSKKKASSAKSKTSSTQKKKTTAGTKSSSTKKK